MVDKNLYILLINSGHPGGVPEQVMTSKSVTIEASSTAVEANEELLLKMANLVFKFNLDNYLDG